jgi:hypothetical protein
MRFPSCAALWPDNQIINSPVIPNKKRELAYSSRIFIV